MVAGFRVPFWSSDMSENQVLPVHGELAGGSRPLGGDAPVRVPGPQLRVRRHALEYPERLTIRTQRPNVVRTRHHLWLSARVPHAHDVGSRAPVYEACVGVDSYRWMGRRAEDSPMTARQRHLD